MKAGTKASGGCIREICEWPKAWNQKECACLPPDDPSARGEGNSITCYPTDYPDLRNDPRHDDCHGMCGNDCNCWPVVCGDCGYHVGCAVHGEFCATCYDTYGLAVPACAVCWFGLSPEGFLLEALLVKGGC
jgi:hypothetical protein